MPSLELLQLLNVKMKETPAAETDIRETPPIEGQNALQIQPDEIPDNDYRPYDLQARREGWLVLQSNEMYNAQAMRTSDYIAEVFIARMGDSDNWEAWREGWKRGEPSSTKVRQIAKGVPFELALKQATGYLKVLTRRK